MNDLDMNVEIEQERHFCKVIAAGQVAGTNEWAMIMEGFPKVDFDPEKHDHYQQLLGAIAKLREYGAYLFELQLKELTVDASTGTVKLVNVEMAMINKEGWGVENGP